MTRLTYHEAREAVQRLGISTILQYRARYREVPGLPSSPPQAYEPSWENWPAFLASRPLKFLPIAEAMTAVKPLAIKDQYEYRRRYREHPGLASNPQTFYPDWPGWSVYLGKSSVKDIRHKPLDLAASQRLVRELGLTTRQMYNRVAFKDPRLTRAPERLPGWPGWAAFLGVAAPEKTWLSYAELKALVQAQGWTDSRTYHARYREHEGLPQSPERLYREWEGWAAFLAPKPRRFLLYAEASRLVHTAGIQSFRDYAAEYDKYPGLPSTPNKTYAGEWHGWAAFLAGTHTRDHEDESS
ncbi:integrase repeat-containing protein [Deinococcus marmoris]|uniref:integrase repeat-containing protein n=1 Tax=Deinococcus marmoris TaxID=249408 RepID=UPI000496E7E1|nr:integrase repeat-containing protein [Deinococcus marmoris]